MTEFVQGSDEALAIVVRQLKDGIIAVIDDPNTFTATWPEGAKQWVHPIERFHVDLAILQGLENEIRARGLDPSHEVFGMDILGQVAELKAEQSTDYLKVGNSLTK
jgi:hypothetical protein